MSASASRPRITVQAVVAWIAPASSPIAPPYRRAASNATPRASPAAAMAEGSRAASGLTPPASRPTAAASQNGKGGFSSQGRPPIVGCHQFPEARISRAPWATNASW